MSSLLSSGSTLVPILSWSFLPSILTRVLLTFLYNSSILARPTDQRAAFIHAQSARALVIISYLVYSFHHSILGAPQNYYHILGLPLDVDAEGVKRSFRALARKFHPDKVGPQGEAYFILLRRAHDALQDAGKRFAYDRFGPEVIEWRDCVTLREYMQRGLKSCVGFYVVNPIVYTIVTYLGGHNTASHFWRISTLFLLLCVELHLLISPSPPQLLRLLLPNSTQHDVIRLLHELFTISLLATQQLAPVITALELGPTPATQKGQEMEALEQMSAQLDAMAAQTELHSRRSVAEELRPLRPAPMAGAATVQKAAEEAARRNATPKQSAAAAAAAQTQREPSQAEVAWLRLFTRHVLRAKLTQLLPVREVEKDIKEQQRQLKEGSAEVTTTVQDPPSSASTQPAPAPPPPATTIAS